MSKLKLTVMLNLPERSAVVNRKINMPTPVFRVFLLCSSMPCSLNMPVLTICHLKRRLSFKLNSYAPKQPVQCGQEQYTLTDL